MTMPCRLWRVDTITKTNNRLAAPSPSLINWCEKLGNPTLAARRSVMVLNLSRQIKEFLAGGGELAALEI